MNEPRLRFKGFKDEWENKKLKDIANIVGGGTPSTNISNYWNGNINWYSPNEIDEKPFMYKSNKKITKEGLKNSSARIHPINTILFTSRAGIGKMTIIKEPAATSQGFQSIELKKNIYPYFIYSLKNKIKHSAIRLSSGSTFLEISKRSVEKINFDLPNYKEQQKIGHFFEKLDQLIQLQSDKLEHLKVTKKGYLQKTYTSNSKNPMLRFKEFIDSWKNSTFINILNYEQPQKYIVNNDNYSKSGTPVLTANKSFILGYTKEENIYNKGKCIIFDDFTEDYKFVDFPYMVKSSAIKILTTKENYDIKFVVGLFDTNRFINEGHSRHYISTVQKQKTKTPSYKEQQKIGQLFSNLDKQINIQQQKLDNLKKQKKAYLQKMFI